MTEDQGFKFGCPHCTQHIRAFLEHVGYQINCPTCGQALLVPDPRGVDPNAVVMGEEYDSEPPADFAEDTHGFSYEEWELLQDEDYEAVETISNLDRDLWWECGAAAELIAARLRLLDEAVSPEREIFYHPGTHDEHIAFIYHINQRAQDFFDIMNFIYHAMSHELQRISVRNSLTSVIELADRVGREIHRLKDFHDFLYEHSLPQEQPFPEIQQIMVNWAPYVYSGLQQCVNQLREHSRGEKGSWADARMHVSLFPANLPTFFILKDQLAMRFGKG